MAFITLNGVTLHYQFRAGTGTPIVFLNSLGTDLRIWDGVIALLKTKAPVLCLDKRGHGLSDDGPITMELLGKDVSALMDHLALPAALVCGVSVGGQIAQALAHERPDQVAGLVLCCTAARIGDPDSWNARIKTVRDDGLHCMADAILERWFSPGFQHDNAAELAGYRNMLARTSASGYVGVCTAIRDTDFTTQSQDIKVPTYCIAGAQDLATPPSVVEHLAGLVTGARFEIIDACGHLPCIEAPEAMAEVVNQMSLRSGCIDTPAKM